MTMESYTIDKVIGEGSYGKALLCKENATDEFVVIKQISFTNLTEQEREDSRKETQILSRLHHPNIIGYRGSFLEHNKFHIVMDYADDGDLGEKIAECQGYFSEDQILHWFVQICLGLKHIHDRKILHRDLKTQNVFMMKNDVVKLGDFGISKVLDHTTSFAKTSIGTPYYLSPEICEGKPYNAKSDIWSLGCVLYEMCTKKHPFDSNCINGLIVKIIRSKPTPIPKQYSSNIRSLIDLMLNKNASKRPSINQILKIPFIKDMIGKILTQTIAKIEFCHTVFHGVKGGETPDVILVPDTIEGDPLNQNESQIPRPKSKSKLAVRKSRIPTSQKSSRASVSRQKKVVTKEEIVQQKKAIVSAERQQIKEDRAKKQLEDKKQLEIQQSKRQHVIDEQKQKKRERELKMAQLRKEERERQKHYESLEAPFKKIRKQSSGKISSNSSQSPQASPSASQDEIRPPSQKSDSPKAHSSKSSSDHLSSEKLENSQEDDHEGDDLFEDDFIDFDDEDNNEAPKEVDDLYSLAAVASDMKDNPPGDDEEYDEDREEEQKMHDAATKFIFRGKELPISEKDPRSVRNESVRAFIEKNLGAEKFLAAYRLITEDSSTMNEDEFEKKLGTILTTQKEMDFCPLIQQLVVSELVED